MPHRPTALLLAALAVASFPWRSAAQTAPLDRATVAAWRQDLRYMAAEMPRRHRDLYHTISRSAFDSAVASLDARIPSLQRHQVILELARIAALVGDGHTNIAPTRDPKIGFRTYPIALYLFSDGLFIRAADSAHAGLLGARVVRIGGHSVEEAYAAVRPLIGRDNEMGVKFFAPFLLVMPEVLHGTGLVPDMEQARFTLERNGRRSEIALEPAGPARMMAPETDQSWIVPSGWIDARQGAARPTPLWLEDPSDKFRYRYLPDSRTLYVQFNEVGNKPGETVAQFCGKLFAFARRRPARRLVLDLRLNAGGDGTLNRPLLLGIIKAESLDVRGRFFTIIGRRTWSAAQFLATQLENYTNTIFVGEPTASRGNAYGDSYRIALPNSGITVRVSTLWWQLSDPRDARPWTPPEIATDLSFEDYRSNRDPALEAILSYQHTPPLADQLEQALHQGGFHLAEEKHRAYKADPRHRFIDTEAGLNGLGYRLLAQGQLQQAITIFKLNADDYPDSWNVHDSLGEAYLKAGETAMAVRSYQRSVALNPDNQHAIEILRGLRP
ncbi:MAG: hypothetical protein ACJ8DC_11980 [Gemmatimonadales bacterium]